jgi:hypothetical protein
VIERLKLAVMRGRELDTLPRFGPECRNRKTLFAGGHEFHRPTESAGCNRNDRGPLGEAALGAEGPADIPADNPDLTWLDAELGRKPVFDSINILARLMDGQLRAIPNALGRKQFDRVVMLSRSRIAGADFDGSGFIGRREIANFGIVVLLVLLSELLFKRPFRIECSRRRLLLVFDANLVGRLGRLPGFRRAPPRPFDPRRRSRRSQGEPRNSKRDRPR